MFLLDVVLGLLMGKKKSTFSPEAIVDQFFIGLKKILQSLIILLICSVLLCILLGYLIDRTLNLLDNQNLHLSNSIILLIVLIVVDLALIFWSLQKINEKPQTQVKEETRPKTSGSPIESAVAALIFDYVKERESKRVEEVREKL